MTVMGERSRAQMVMFLGLATEEAAHHRSREVVPAPRAPQRSISRTLQTKAASKAERANAPIQTSLRLKKRNGPWFWGGRRANAGRPRTLPHDPSHAKRPVHHARHPSHITLRVTPEVGRLRRRHLWKAFHYAATRTGASDAFRISHFSIQGNHLHLLTESSNAVTLGTGVKRFQIIAAKAINKRLGRTGKVFAHRYHRVDITTPRQMRHALAYVLCNWRRHREDVTTPGAENVNLDPYSTAWAFTGWRDLDADEPLSPRLPAAPPTTWLLRVGWQKHGMLGVREVPRALHR